ncbi:hypothetical protein A0H81_10651 [Grifola frondosa]|uniref:Uncharacterized protein n=1 Tax=Grifola frondosa TaxID=5627 RepID=A0A1C7LZG0_GRIFR|nr:hypothetical protein A0H81_10651 [Grifola frondosa]
MAPLSKASLLSTRSAHSFSHRSTPNIPGHKAEKSVPRYAQDDCAILLEANLKAVPFSPRLDEGQGVIEIEKFNRYPTSASVSKIDPISPSWHEGHASPLVFVLDSFGSFLPHDAVESAPTSDAVKDTLIMDHKLGTTAIDSAAKDTPASGVWPP